MTSLTTTIGQAGAYTLRAALVRAGMDANIANRVVDDYGNLDLALLAAASVGEIEVRSRLVPTIKFKLTDYAGNETPATTGVDWLKILQPAVIVHSPFGTIRYAPRGEPSADQWKKNLFVTVVGIGAVGGLVTLIAKNMLKK